MAKKKSKPANESLNPPSAKKAAPKSKPKSPKKAALPRLSRGDLPPEVDAMIRRLMGEPPPRKKDMSPQDKADDLLHQAFQAEDPREVERLALKALEVWPNCADAYSLLAEEAKGPKETLRLYAEAVAAGERDLGEETFREHAGHFWMMGETRPYMRAMNGFANSLWILGKREQAVEQYRKMLELNPGDNQGIRYILCTCLLELGRDDELSTLLKSYDDSSADWAYGEVLMSFRREGDSARSRALLEVARKFNNHVPDCLSGRIALPESMPPYIERGEMSEAVAYTVANLRAWRSVHGALDWIRRRTTSPTTRPTRSKPTKAKPKSKGPTPLIKKRLTRLPQSADAVWQAEFRQLPMWINVDAEPVRPWFVLVVSRTEELILAQDILEEPPTSAVLWDKLVKAMEKPSMGEPHRPSEIQVRSSELWDDLEPHLDDVGIERLVVERLDLMEEIVEQLIVHMCGRTLAPSLLEMPGITEPMVASFFRSAAEYYRKAPWQHVASEETIKIDCDRFESGPWYTAIIGQLGMTPGFALYEDMESLLRLREGDASDEKNARETVALSVTYGDQTEIQVADFEDVERHGWEIAAPEGYPSAMRKERGLVMRPPLSWELQLLEACLVAIPKFVMSRDREDTSPVIIEATTGSGSLSLSLAWM